MIKLASLVKEGGKLFGSRASRVSTEEMNYVYNELRKKVGNQFKKFDLSRVLSAEGIMEILI